MSAGAGSRPLPSRRRDGASTRDADLELAALMSRMATLASSEVHEIEDWLGAELWASTLIGTWHVRRLLEGDVEELFFPAFVHALERLGTQPALATLRAVSRVGRAGNARNARAAAGRLATRGLEEPAWGPEPAGARPVAAELMHDEHFDDGVSVLIEFDSPAPRHTLGIYIDHNMGGLVKDVFLAGPLSEVRELMKANAARSKDELGLRAIDLGEARARVSAALEQLDHTWEPSVSEDVRALRALIDTRMPRLPGGHVLEPDFDEISLEEREALLAEFLASPEGARWAGDEDAEFLLDLAINFGCDYNHGGPLRWSPVVVEIFMTSWLPHKVAREQEFFKGVPEVLRAWVRYAGRVRALPAAQRREAVAAVKRFRTEMLENAEDPASWGPAKTIATAARQAGVDLADPGALEGFVEQYNAQLDV